MNERTRKPPAERLRDWVDDMQLSARLGTPHYKNPGELKADIRVVLDALDRVRNEAPDRIKALLRDV